MLNAIIIEDENAALQNLTEVLGQVTPEVKIIAALKTVRESLAFFAEAPEAEIIFSDVQLPDGLSFTIFSETKIHIPVVFTTGYNDFMLNAFEYNGIDYILKPVSKNDVYKALLKYRMLENHFAENSKAVQKFSEYMNGRKKSRLLVKKGIENIALPINQIVLLYTQNKIVYVLATDGKKYIAENNLSELETVLDEHFFRANRQYIVNIDFIKGFKTYEKVKLMVDLTIPEIGHTIIVSQETAPSFRRWIYEA